MLLNVLTSSQYLNKTSYMDLRKECYFRSIIGGAKIGSERMFIFDSLCSAGSWGLIVAVCVIRKWKEQ